jgi:uncharacterized iron-regulated protein
MTVVLAGVVISGIICFANDKAYGAMGRPTWYRAPRIIFAALLIMSVSFHCHASEQTLPVYNLEVSFDLGKNTLNGISTISIPEGLSFSIDVENLTLHSVTINNKKLEPLPLKTFQAYGTVIISYQASFKQVDHDTTTTPGYLPGNIISAQGVSLTEAWYPSLETLSFFNLKAMVPEHFSAVSEAELITERRISKEKEYSFTFKHPLDHITFVAAQYAVTHESYNTVEIYTYFFPEDSSLAEEYRKHTKRYLDRYREIFGPYPYKRFSIVENFLPTGYSMPTFTLLGRSVVRLPFITSTSLGHEILHQWFGNYVFADFKNGNWCEGLTSYLSDYFHEEQKEPGWLQRKKLLLNYRNYVNADNEMPLDRFISKTDFATTAIGYGKGSLFFHMLKNQVGKEIFFAALLKFIEEYKFKQASWDDLLKAFETASGTDLQWFFNQWLTRKGLPELRIVNPEISALEGSYSLSMRIIQHNQAYTLPVSLRIITDKGDVEKTVLIDKQCQPLEFSLPGKPFELIVDENYDLARNLTDDEVPAVISNLLGAPERIIVLPDNETERFESTLSFLTTKGFEIRHGKDIKDSTLKKSSVLLLGTDGPVFARLFGRGNTVSVSKTETDSSLVIKQNPFNSLKTIAVLQGQSDEKLALVARKMFHYGNYSHIAFRNSKNILRKMHDSNQGIRSSLYTPVVGFMPKNTLSLETIIENISQTPVIYLGEGHTLFEDHRVQLEVVRGLYERERKFGIGMEMFTKPTQQSLDSYISGKTTEKEFLKSSRYYKDWKYNYHLYREILQFAKDKNIPVIALNQEQELIRKVARQGIDGLSSKEKEKLPPDMDMSDEKYKKRLKQAYGQHDASRGISFENFYQSQILWDETMAHAIDDFLSQNQDHQIVVIAGSGHISYGSGIPKMTFRLNQKEYITLVNAKAGIPAEGIADYVLFPEPLTAPSSPRLGIYINEKDTAVTIEEFSRGSVAKNAGMKKGDQLLYVDDIKVTGLEDLRIALFDKKANDTITVTALRKVFLFPDKELAFEIKLKKTFSHP